MAEPTTQQAKPKAPKQTTTVTLKSPDGARLKLVAKADRKRGPIAYAVHTTPNGTGGKKVHTKGASSQHPTLEAAITKMQALAVAAVKAGPADDRPEARRVR